MWELDYKESWEPKNWCFWNVVLEKTLKSPLDCKEIQPVHPKGDQSDVHWKDWCWSWNSNTLATWCKELTHLKRPWCWEGLRAGGEGDNRGWDGWMASPTQWTWVWVDPSSWWWIGRPVVLQFMGLQWVGHDCGAELIFSMVPQSIWESPGKILSGWSIYRYNPMTNKNGLKILDLYCHRMGKRTEIPLYSGLFSYNHSWGLIKFKTLHFSRGTIPAGTNLPLSSAPIWVKSGLNFGCKTMITEKWWWVW